jgi:hypothetical protein
LLHRTTSLRSCRRAWSLRFGAHADYARKIMSAPNSSSKSTRLVTRQLSAALLAILGLTTALSCGGSSNLEGGQEAIGAAGGQGGSGGEPGG